MVEPDRLTRERLERAYVRLVPVAPGRERPPPPPVEESEGVCRLTEAPQPGDADERLTQLACIRAAHNASGGHRRVRQQAAVVRAESVEARVEHLAQERRHARPRQVAQCPRPARGRA